MLKCNGVFEGGGVKGTAFLGAIKVFENRGYEFQNVAGTSAGAIIAALIAAGLSATEMESAMNELDYKKLCQKSFPNIFGFCGEILSTVLYYGIYSGDYFENWIHQVLKKKNKTLFGDIKTYSADKKYKYKLQVIVSDITEKKLLVLPENLKNFGIEPDSFSIAKAVRMSMSIPIFFKPYRLRDRNGIEHIIADGGLLSNYPVWLLDDGVSVPPYPTFGFNLTGCKDYKQDVPIDNFIQYGMNIVSTLLEGNDNYHISKSKGDFQRTVLIPTEIYLDGKCKDIHTTYFDINEEEKNCLFQNGEKAALKFLKSWNFERWVELYRK